MPVKKNSSGKFQNYDPKTGKYAKANIIDEIVNVDYPSVLLTFFLEERIKHISVGDFTVSSKRYISGGHGQDNIIFLNNNGIKYEINVEYNNGVRVGNILDSTNYLFVRGNNHSWFPKNWSKEDIQKAIEYGLKNYNGNYDIREIYEYEYKDIKISIIFGKNKSISTAYPNKNQEGGIKYDNR